MAIPIPIQGFEGRGLMLAGGFWSGAKVVVDGQIVKPVKRIFLLRNSTGQNVEIKFKSDFTTFIDGIPKFEVNGQPLELIKPLQTVEYVWCCVPLLLILLGGAIGGALGGASSAINGRIFRQPWNTGLKYLVTGLITFGAVLFWVILVTLIQITVHPPVSAPTR